MKFGNFVETMESLGVEPVSDMELEENNTELTQTLAEVISDVKEAERTDSAIDTAVWAVDQIGKAQEILEQKSEGLSATETATMESLYSSIFYSLGIPNNRATMESNGSDRQAWIATMEDDRKSLLSRVWDALKSLLEAAAGFVAGLLKNKTVLGKYISDLKDRIKAMPKFSGGEKIEAQFKDYGQVKKSLDNCNILLTKVQDSANFSKTIGDLTKKPGNTLQDVENKLLPVLMKLDDLAVNIPQDEFLEGDKLIRGEEVKRPKIESLRGEDGDQELVLLEIKKGSGYSGVKRLSRDEALDVLDRAKTSLDNLKALSNIDGAIRSFVGRIKDEFKVGWFTAKASNKGEEQDIAAAVFNASRLVTRVIARNYATVIPSLVFRNIKAAADYARSSAWVGA